MLQRIKKDFRDKLNYYNKKSFVQQTYKNNKNKFIQQYIPKTEYKEQSTNIQQNKTLHTQHIQNEQQEDQLECQEMLKNNFDDSQLGFGLNQHDNNEDHQINSVEENPESMDNKMNGTNNKIHQPNHIEQYEQQETEYSNLKPLNKYEVEAALLMKLKSTSECFKKHPKSRMEGKSSINMHRYVKRFHNYATPKSPSKQVKFSPLCKITEAEEIQFDFY